MRQLWPVCIPVIVLFLAEIILGVLIKRNKYKLKLKKESKDIFLAKIKNFQAIPGRPILSFLWNSYHVGAADNSEYFCSGG